MKFNNLAEALQDCANTAKATEGFRFLDEAGKEDGFLSFAELRDKAAQMAVALKKIGLKKGDAVGLIIPEQKDFVVSFYACVWAGLVAVPLAAPYQISKLDHYIKNLQEISKTAEIKTFVVTSRLKPYLGGVLSSQVKKISLVSELQNESTAEPLEPTTAEDLAFLQFTSGSTAEPKGVKVSNRNIMANCKCIAEDGIKLNSADSFFSWLPFYHDMGLIGFLLTTVIYRCSGTFLSPLAFIKRPNLWLKGISKYSATISFAPNFAYSLCVKRIKEEELKDLDLSKWRLAGCGAEPIQSSTVESFIEKFSKCGFASKSFKACYGMAESTLAVAFPKMDDDVLFDTVQDGTSSIKYISCGGAFPDHEISVRAEDLTCCKEHVVGEIAIKGPSVTQGYINNDNATAATIKDGWLYTGDYGYLAEGNLYICGRRKDLIIISGKNYYPSDVEALLVSVPGLRQGNAVAFSISAEQVDKLIICAEKSKDSKHSDKDITDVIRGEVLSNLGITVADVVLLPAGALPKTTSGKLQRAKVKELYLHSGLGAAGQNQLGPICLAWKLGVTWIRSKASYYLANH